MLLIKWHNVNFDFFFLYSLSVLDSEPDHLHVSHMFICLTQAKKFPCSATEFMIIIYFTSKNSIYYKMILQSLSSRLVISESSTLHEKKSVKKPLNEKIKTTYSKSFSKVCDVCIFCVYMYRNMHYALRRLIDNSSIFFYFYFLTLQYSFFHKRLLNSFSLI